MFSIYSQKNSTAQKASSPKVASVLDDSSQSEGLQRKADLVNNAAQRAEAPRPNNTGMPDNLKAGIESLSGFSMDDVRVHYNSSKPATVQALAYTQGTDIHVAPGQEKHLPHEAWHVAQQMAGRVSPTTNINGMPVNDNAGLEHEADVMGEKAIQKIDDKSSKNKGICSNVAQCKNYRAYFETGNDEDCENSRYYVDEYSYVRIAPINAGRNPNQEYHEEKRNFLYVFEDSDIDILDDLFWYNCEINDLWNRFDDDAIATIISTALSCNAKVFKEPKNNLIPFDWSSNESYHPGHPIEKVEPYKDPKNNENLKLYMDRKERASTFAASNFSNSQGFMDACFRCLWYAADEIYPLFDGMSKEDCLKQIGKILLKAKKLENYFVNSAKEIQAETRIDHRLILDYIYKNAMGIQNFYIQQSEEIPLFKKTEE